MKGNIKILFILILVFTVFLRFWRLEDIPYYQRGLFESDLISHITWNSTRITDMYLYLWHDYEANGFNYLRYPFMLLFGNDLFHFRVTTAFFDVLAVIFLFLFIKELYGDKTALVAAFLYTVFPNIVNMSRTGIDVATLSFFLFSSLYLFLKWYKTHKKWFIYIGSFLTGFAVCTHLSFIYVIMSLACLFFFFKNTRNRKSILIDVVVFFLIGAFPFIIGNILGELPTVKYILSSISEQSNLSENFSTRIYFLLGIINDLTYLPLYPPVSSPMYILRVFYLPVYILRFFYLPVFPSMYYLPLIFSLGFLKIFYLFVILLFSLYLLYKRDPRDVFFVSLFSLIFFFSLFSISAPSREQIQIVLPIFIVLTSRMISGKKIKIMLAIFILCYLIMLYRYFNQYTGNEYGYKALIKFFNETDQKKFIVNDDRTRFIIYYYLDEDIWEPRASNPNVIVQYEENKTEFESVEGCIDYVKNHPDFWCVLNLDKYTKNTIDNIIDKVGKNFEKKEIFMSSDERDILYYVLEVKK